MELTIVTDDDQVVTIDLESSSNAVNDYVTLTGMIQAKTSIPSQEQILVYNGTPLQPGKPLTQLQPNDLIMVSRAQDGTASLPPPPQSRPGGPSSMVPPPSSQSASANNNPTALNPDGSAVNPQAFMDMISAVPGSMSQLPPTLVEAIKSKDFSKFQQALKDLHQAKRKAEEEEARFLKLAAEDPFNPEVQRRLEQSIQERNIQQNMETAMEHHPEMFGSVHMLYVNMEVNGVAVKAFVDSGAQMTIMSKKCAEYCGVLRLMDTRWQGMAVGVGTTKIVGRIHLAPLRAGGVHFPSSITVLDDDKMPFLLGLDNLKAHQTCIDLRENVLRFGSHGIVLPFLAEHEIPKGERFDAQQGEEGGSSGGGGGGGAGNQPGTTTTSVFPPQQQQQQQQQEQQREGSVVPDGWEEKVARLMGLGFDREQCLNALKATGGNEDAAGSLLFG